MNQQKQRHFYCRSSGSGEGDECVDYPVRPIVQRTVSCLAEMLLDRDPGLRSRDALRDAIIARVKVELPSRQAFLPYEHAISLDIRRVASDAVRRRT